ncbi:hypothetical protein ACHHYP_07428 [Achlya hypogyna]|uniref:Secreted protein n=1 Tax=Achlya hypogyna TaxID=1202772 RepID=A0A0A7CNS3_ACHHY|nr:secreted protein [Achlya hypogyna]OQR98953.1 hypothetical protein ACHHYP_07428 [Achlya hypogyna]
MKTPAFLASALFAVATGERPACGPDTPSPTMTPTADPTFAPTSGPTFPPTPAPGQWTSLGGFAHDISFDGTNVCVKNGDGAFCGFAGQPFDQWKPVATQLKDIEQVACAKGVAFVWGRSSGDLVMKTINLKTGEEHDAKMQDGESPRQFSTDGSVVCGTTNSRLFGAKVTNGALGAYSTISEDHEIYKTAVAGEFLIVAGYDGALQATLLDAENWDTFSFDVVPVDLRAREISTDGVDLCIVTYELDIACSKLSSGLEKWTKVPGEWKTVAVSNNTIYGVDFKSSEIRYTYLK